MVLLRALFFIVYKQTPHWLNILLLLLNVNVMSIYYEKKGNIYFKIHLLLFGVIFFFCHIYRTILIRHLALN